MVRFSRYEPLRASEAPPVSIIVCAHDEEKNLRELLPLLLNQAYTQFEVIIVNDRSNDGTYDFVLLASVTEKKLRVVDVPQGPEHVNPKKFALTLGIKAAHYDWVLLTDADCRPQGDQWLHSMMSAAGSPATEIVLGYSAYRKLPGWLNSFIRFETQLTGIQYAGLALAGMPYMGVGRNLLYRKSVFLRSKGFGVHRKLTGGDDDLFVNRIADKSNTRVVLDRDSLILSSPKTSWSTFFRQKVRHLAAGKKYKVGHRMVLAAFSLSYIGVWTSALPQLILNLYTPVIVSMVVVRWLLMGYAGHLFSLRSGDPMEPAKWPVLDILYPLYYLTVGPAALLTKKIRWS